jgi:methionyl-tRNA formyltransferase
MSDQAKTLLQEYFPTGEVLTWQQGDSEAHTAIRSRLLSGEWRLCISFYNDYIFSPEEIQVLGCVVNIHPALPTLRGRGYDILPLLQGHREHGVTLHFVSKAIDAGDIIDVITHPIPLDIGYSEFRLRNQTNSLTMLDRLLQRCRHTNMAHLHQNLNQTAAAARLSWSGGFVTSARLACILREFRKRDPDHPLLNHIPRSLEVGYPSCVNQGVGMALA